MADMQCVLLEHEAALLLRPKYLQFFWLLQVYCQAKGVPALPGPDLWCSLGCMKEHFSSSCFPQHVGSKPGVGLSSTGSNLTYLNGSTC